MSLNPYESPPGEEPEPIDTVEPTAEAKRVAGPAIGLMAISIISIVMLLLGLGINLYLLATGQADGVVPESGVSVAGILKIRIAFGVLTLFANAAILQGAIQMRRLTGYKQAESTCMLALVPCCSPCLVLGIPFGIWGLLVLSDPQVKQAFKS